MLCFNSTENLKDKMHTFEREYYGRSRLAHQTTASN